MSAIVRDNYRRDKSYCPYCLLCHDLNRMVLIEAFLWKCRHCRAYHDEREEAKAEVLAALAAAGVAHE